MNGWDEGHRSWWLNLESNPEAVISSGLGGPSALYRSVTLVDAGVVGGPALKIVLVLSMVVARLAALDAGRGSQASVLARRFDKAIKLHRDLRVWVVEHAELTGDTRIRW